MAPPFRARTTRGEAVSLTSFTGTWLVLYFFPRAFTPGCTRETIAFRDHFDELQSLGARVVGVSADVQATQCAFAETHRLPFPLIADEDAAIARAYGALRRFPKSVRRLTFVIDPQGRVAARIAHELRVGLHLDEVVRFLRHTHSRT